MAKAHISAYDYVQTLKHSFFPTVITEGLDDYSIFRRIEEKFLSSGVSLMPVGGKSVVLEIFANRHEFGHIKTAFIVDQDFWIFSGVPASYQDPSIIMTSGYSIENDLFVDAEMTLLLLAKERVEFERDLEQLLRWFSYAVRENLDGHVSPLDIHPDRIVDHTGTLLPSLGDICGYTGPCPVLFPSLRVEYAKELRGKTLLSLLLRYLSASRRAVRHNRKSLMEIGSVRNGPNMSRIQSRIRDVLAV